LRLVAVRIVGGAVVEGNADKLEPERFALGAVGRTCAARSSAEIFASASLIDSRSLSQARLLLAASCSSVDGDDNAMITTSVLCMFGR
jgi:hypothetical protein